eukprot:COSAG06_NODE_16295_length_1008_cov_2.402640_1_plen_122_part_00
MPLILVWMPESGAADIALDAELDAPHRVRGCAKLPIFFLGGALRHVWVVQRATSVAQMEGCPLLGQPHTTKRSRALALSRGHARPWTLSLRPAPLAAGSAATAAGLGVSARAAAEAAAQEA